MSEGMRLEIVLRLLGTTWVAEAIGVSFVKTISPLASLNTDLNPRCEVMTCPVLEVAFVQGVALYFKTSCAFAFPTSVTVCPGAKLLSSDACD